MISALLAIAPLLLSPLPQSGQPAQKPMLKRAYLMLGQSNMQGRSCPETLPASLQTVQPRVHIFNRTNCNLIPGAPASWQPLHAGVNANPCNTIKFGPELGLGTAIHADIQDDVYIIKYAFDASRLASPDTKGSNPTFSWHTDPNQRRPGQLFGKALAHCMEAQDALPGLKIEGVFWVQGIQDMLSLAESNLYETNLTRFIADLRRELFLRGLSRRLNVPFAISMIPEFIQRVNANFQDVVRCAQQAVACNVPNVGVYDPYMAKSILRGSGCNQNYPEPVHFDTDSQLAHGIALYNASKNPGCPEFSRDSCSAIFDGTQATVNFTFQYPAAYAGMQYFIVGTGLGVDELFNLDLSNMTVNDYYFSTGGPGSVGASGVLDGSGTLTATFVMPPASQPQAPYGRTLHHSVFVVDNQTLVHRTNPVSLFIHP